MNDLEAARIIRAIMHNPEELSWPLGAHLVSMRQGYLHHGIYVGNGRVIHYAGLCESWRYGPVEEVSLSNFSRCNDVWAIEEHNSKFTAQEVVARAQSRLGERCYKLLTNNCEHFCNWCTHGKAWSDQVRRFWLNPIFATRLIRLVFLALLGWPKAIQPVRVSQQSVGSTSGEAIESRTPFPFYN